ncbi:RIP metalloprotease RseP [Abyssisolibacter fermentans]|uniref:RIP metalloprotease RseP n=1 Tax=Abyssisolibacter fermentans TaxID=1766203 RepID=UPI000A7320B1|nr:RIP metalloprotease RseP [Abyssisolibacter fermentans]
MPITTILAAIFVFLLVVVFHEFGHFTVAKLVGIKVHEFSVGMGPKIFGKRKGETQYSIRALPIGGYVKMEGEDEESKDARSFSNKSIPARMAVLAAGAIMNFVLAILLFCIIAYSVGDMTTTIGKVIPGQPAYEAGIEAGDKIVAIYGAEVNSWQEVTDAINKSENKQIDLTLERNGNRIKKTIIPAYNEEAKRYMIGIETKQERSIVKSVKRGFTDTFNILGQMFDFLGKLFAGQVGSKDVAGPVGIIKMVGQAASYGFIPVLFFAGLISVNLGFFNLLPIPALDGGRIIFLIIEALRGKPISAEKEGIVHFIGFVFLMLIMVAVTYKDIIY